MFREIEDEGSVGGNLLDKQSCLGGLQAAPEKEMQGKHATSQTERTIFLYQVSLMLPEKFENPTGLLEPSRTLSECPD